MFRENRIKEREGVAMMMALGVRNLPTIVMDGDIEFISRIPPIRDIGAKIDEHLSAKAGRSA